MRGFAMELGFEGPPFVWNLSRRSEIRAELDAALFLLFDLPRVDVDYIMDTFPIVEREDQSQYGRFETKLAILRVYDRLSNCIATHSPFKTSLLPPPGASDPSANDVDSLARG
jgi:hypothetical protein